MEERTRQQLLEEILQRLCRVKLLNVEVMDDLLLQLKTITRTKGDEESSLLFIVKMARKELKKAKTAKIKAEVVWSNQDGFGVKFLHIKK